MPVLEVRAPAVVPIAAGAVGSKLEDGLCIGESPSGARDAESILDEVAAGALDDAGCDREALREKARVVDSRRVLVQVLERGIELLAVLRGELPVGRGLTDRRHDVERMAREELLEDVSDPSVGGFAIVGAEQDGDQPQVVKDVNEVEDDGDAHASLACLGLDVGELFLVAVEENDRLACAVGIAALGLVEHLGDALGLALGDAGRDAVTTAMRLSERRIFRCAIGSPRTAPAFAAAASFRVASRSASGRIVMPLPSVDITCNPRAESVSFAGGVRVA